MFCCGCSGYIYLKGSKYISEYRSCLFYLKSEDFIATFTSGKRERNFFYNGKKTSLVPFGVLAVKYLSNVDIAESRECVIFIDSMQYTGNLEYNPVDGTFVFDVGKEITQDSDIYLRLFGGGINDQAHMKCVSKGWISYKKAFDIATKKMKPAFDNYIKNGKLKGEFFIKIVGEQSLENLSYYVQFVGKDKKYLVVLVDVYTGEISYTKGL